MVPRVTFNVIASLALLALIPAAVRADLDLPVNGPVTSGVGWRVDPFGSGKLVFHRGIDIAAPEGTPVRVTRRGRVVHAGIHGGHGLTVIVEHDGGDKTLYGHNSALKVRLGEELEAGAVIALSGNTGRSTGPHVHYEVWPGGKGTAVLAKATVDESALPSVTPDREARRRQEQRMDELVDSILRGFGRPAVSGGKSGEGG
ncbi:M23 family metallopeptidase [Geobacter pickeringii]|uniref:Peptidase M23 n=1 Tax=Geobacter pickeringii TaxID=345632 RepID=A0A0B5BDV1_9BACT|nr:M23 family metallopeptidase [Geobacter pickeringii]AJE04878.1 peptidase M23 [Geobacter pickeringii]